MALRAGGLGPRAARRRGIRDAGASGGRDRAQLTNGLCAPSATLLALRRSLPEVVHLAEDFLVLDVAAVLLPQRRATHGALEATNVPDEVVDLGRGRRWGAAERGPLRAPGSSLPGPLSRHRRRRSEGTCDFPHFSSVTWRRREVEINSAHFSDGNPGAQRDAKICPKTLESGRG